jgi:hypothetical protein
MNGATYDPRPNTPPRTPPAGVQTRREHVKWCWWSEGGLTPHRHAVVESQANEASAGPPIKTGGAQATANVEAFLILTWARCPAP